ncbi:polysaccharide deacetylase family protein [Paenibacillus ferrarius]|uniref:polysaccharide deacetylase family protein n=1 Tax=Paenibacillus ferrarius TaxID=1469647 RepID=UPI003D2C3CD7
MVVTFCGLAACSGKTEKSKAPSAQHIGSITGDGGAAVPDFVPATLAPTPDGHTQASDREARATLPNAAMSVDAATSMDAAVKTALMHKYEQAVPRSWGETVPGVKRRLATVDRVVALTFDACGGPGGSGYDKVLIDYLTEEKIPATLFINSRWIDANPDIFQSLAANPLFEIENHGKQHLPLSVNGRSAYGVKGTGSVGEVVDEALYNKQTIEELTGRKTKLFRSGTAFYDDVAVRVLGDLELQPVGFDVLGDAGATFSAKQIEQALSRVKPGSIVILHMNQPTKETAAGIRLAVPELRQKGFSFVKLEDYSLE